MMSSDRAGDRWSDLRDQAQQRWGRLTTSDLEAVQGRLDKLVELVQDRYGYSARKAQREVNKFIDRYGTNSEAMQGTASGVIGKVQSSMNRYPWAFVAGALVLGVVIVGFVFKPFDR
jgi:uncharacterized protein YjbJ (UPF0337 family)